MKLKEIPIIDLFAGPGGLGEGFSSYRGPKGERFKIKLSIEKDPIAHKTLTLRAFFRSFEREDVPDYYYRYLRGEIEKDELKEKCSEKWAEAEAEAQCLELGKDDLTGLIRRRLDGAKNWVLIGGPPCQAYSLVGRATMSGQGLKRENETEQEYQERGEKKRASFESDHRHTLYLEYLKTIANHWPSVFVMENVKGILSSKLDGKLIFPKILKDLENPRSVFAGEGKSYRYQIRSFVVPSGEGLFSKLEPKDYLIQAEKFGIPQTRHRVILLGVREDFWGAPVEVLEEQAEQSLGSVIGDLPRLSPGLSKNHTHTPYEALCQIQDAPWWNRFRVDPEFQDVVAKMESQLKKCLKREKRGAGFQLYQPKVRCGWTHDERLEGVCNHETRSHIRDDLWRYFFSACYGEVRTIAPHLRDFPEGLLPLHRNISEAVTGTKFGDRFRVQISSKPSSTVISHISKDGHYFIHPDPTQYRSFTVREAARIQTFPDNYFFEGPRTQQFHQVGNAVPPKLAYQIAGAVYSLVKS